MRFVLLILICLPHLLNAAEAAREYSAYYSGNDLYEICNGIPAQQAVCASYIAGVTDGLGQAYFSQSITGRNMEHCVPLEVEAIQLKDILLKYLGENPDKRHLAAPFLVELSLREAFPCSG